MESTFHVKTGKKKVNVCIPRLSGIWRTQRSWIILNWRILMKHNNLIQHVFLGRILDELGRVGCWDSWKVWMRSVDFMVVLYQCWFSDWQGNVVIMSERISGRVTLEFLGKMGTFCQKKSLCRGGERSSI